MIADNHLLLKQSIYWQRHTLNQKYFFANYDGELLLLRLNNFPDEPLLTLINKLDILDIEETPANWVVPF